MAEIKALLQRYDDINAKFAEELSPEQMDKVLEEQGKVQDRIEAADGWDLDALEDRYEDFIATFEPTRISADEEALPGRRRSNRRAAA